jgi:hypothetical protein
MTEVTVTVTREHIDRGAERTCDRCPVALAIMAAVPGLSFVEVMSPELGYALLFGMDSDVGDMDLPGSAKQFIRDFDAGRPVRPFTFTAQVQS